MSISHTANEAVARQIVDRLRRRPPYGQSWRDFAIREISSALTTAAAQQKKVNAASDRRQNLSLESQ